MIMNIGIVLLVGILALGQGAPFAHSSILHRESPGPLKHDHIEQKLSKGLQLLFQEVGMKDNSMNSQGERLPGKEALVTLQEKCRNASSLSNAIQIVIDAIVVYAEQTSDPQPGGVLRVVGDLLEDLMKRCGNEAVKKSIKRLQNWGELIDILIISIDKNEKFAFDKVKGITQGDTDVVNN